MTDVLMVLEEDGGNLTISSGQTTMTESIETMVLLCLWGGDSEDTGLDATSELQWWGNLLEEDPARHLRSRTQALLQGLPLVPANLKRIEDAVALDLQVLLDAGIASEVNTGAFIPALNTVGISVSVVGVEGDRFSAQYIRAAGVTTA